MLQTDSPGVKLDHFLFLKSFLKLWVEKKFGFMQTVGPMNFAEKRCREGQTI